VTVNRGPPQKGGEDGEEEEEEEEEEEGGAPKTRNSMWCFGGRGKTKSAQAAAGGA